MSSIDQANRSADGRASPLARTRPRARGIRHIGLAGLALVGAGCADPGATSTARGAQIVDQLHSQGTTGFFWLPTVVTRPAPYGDNVPDADPTLRIDEIDPATGATLRTVATFTRTSGPDGERTRIKLRGMPCDADDDDGDSDDQGYFYARWRPTDNASLALRATYRIHVTVPGGHELGFADVDVVRNEREFRGVDRDDFVPLIYGRTLRIKFRIDRPAVDRDGDGVLDWRDNCPSTANADQRDSLRDGKGDACRCVDVNPDDHNPCTVDTCEPARGAVNTPGNVGATCRPSAGACDVAESCTGTSAACPADGFAPSSTVCRGSAGACDVAESCTGASTACPADGFQSPTTICRAATGPCDVAESCTGSGAACPADAFQPPATVCRESAGACDVAESCTGAAAACPDDGFAAGGTACDDATVCNGRETCDGAGSCRSGTALSCAGDGACLAGSCDPARGCGYAPVADGTSCDDSNACTRSDTCQAGACAGASPVTCAASDACHVAGTCDTRTGACSNPAGPGGVACADDGNPCTLDRCDGAGACAHRAPGPEDALPPSEVPSGGLAMWLEADQGVTSSASGLVSRWADQSGHGRDAAQADPRYQPALVSANPEVGGRPTLRFTLGGNGLSGQGQTMPFDGSFMANTDYTVFAVAARNRGGPYGSGNDAQALANFFVSGSSTAQNGNFIVGWENGTTLRFSQYANDLDLTVPGWNSSRMWSLMTFLLDGSAGHSTFLGVTQSPGASNTNRARLVSNAGANVGRFAGTQFWFQGDVAELVFFDHALTCRERMSVEQYLAGKYSLP